MAKKSCLKWLKYLWLFVFCVFGDFLSPAYLPAQRQQNIKFERITIEEGLSQNTVKAVLEDSKGFLWFGTEDGLNRYDGYTFKVYRHNPDEPGSLSNSMVEAICEDDSGVIWVGTRGGGINRFDRKTGSFARYTYKPSAANCLSSNIVWAICGRTPGVLWIGTDKGLNRFDCMTGEFTHWHHESNNSNSLSSSRVKALCPDGDGGLWIGTLGGGLNKLDVKTGTFTHYKHHPDKPGSLNHDDVYAIFIDSDGGLWVGTPNGLGKFDKKEGIFINYTKKYNNLFNLNSHVYSLAGEDSILWIGTRGGGLYQFERKKEIFAQYKNNPGRLTSLSNNHIQCIYADNPGILWVGTDFGLNKFDKKKQKFGHWEMSPDQFDNLNNNNIWSIYKDREGILWLGTEGGLRRFDRKNNKCTPIKTGDSAARLNSDRILFIYEDRSGVLWIGTLTDGLWGYDQKAKRLKYYRHEPLNPQSLSADQVNRIYEDTAGILWIGTTTGLNRFDREKEIFTCYRNMPADNNSLSNDFIFVIYEDQSHCLWIGTEDGLNQFHRGSETFTHWKKDPDNPNSLSNNKVCSICQDKSGIFWIGTWGGGLNKFDQEKGTFRHYLEKDGLPNEYIYGILEDEDGYLWMSTNRGISKFDPKGETFKNYDARDGLQGNEFNAGACFRSDEGEMFFGGSNGFNAFYSYEIKDNPHIPPIVITGFRVFDEPVKIGPDSRLKQSITETKEIVLTHEDNVFSFEFAALDFSNPKKNKYLYKMEGFDRDWNERKSDRRFVTYTNLDPGKYVFRVMGSNNDGVWNEKGTSIKIIITPPFWETWWFRLLAVLAFAVLSYIIINFIRKYITLSGFWKGEKYIGKFKLLDKIGSGGMGTIYKARDTLTKTGTVALKVLRDDLFMSENHRKRFKQEAVIIDQLDHPNIVQIMERGQFEQKLYIVMELLEGKTLAKKIEEEEEIDLKEALDIVIQVADALKKIHSKNIVHRDLKPENVMLVEKEGRRNFVKLLDFGLARTEHQTRITQTGMVLGTLNYMAPEQISHGEFSLASDVYSLGVICYETLTRKVPFPGGKMTDIMRKILNDTPTEPIHYRPEMPTEFNALIMQMIEKESGSRPTVEEVMERLKVIVNG